MDTRARASPITREEVTMKNSFNVLPTAIFVLFFSFSCSSSSKDTHIDSQKQVLARNVILNSSANLQRDQITTTNAAAAAELDTETQVLAENVVVDTSANALSSTNLQSVLDDEMVVNLSTLLPGTTWTVSNRDNFKGTYSGTQATGSITFEDSTITVNSGSLAAAGYVSVAVGELPFTCASSDSKMEYELIGNSVLSVQWSYINHNNVLTQTKHAVAVLSATKDSMTLIGFGGCGILDGLRVSILTKVE